MDEIQVFEAMASAMADRGLATPEQVAADRAALTAELADPKGFNPAPDATSTAAALGAKPAAQPAAAGPSGADPLDALAFAGPSSPASYRFDPPPPGVQHDPELENNLRTVFHQEGVPVPIAREFNRMLNAARLNPPTAEQIKQGEQAGMAALARMWGADRDTNLAIAKAEIQRMEKASPGVVQMLEATGLGNSPWLASTLVALARAKGRAA